MRCILRGLGLKLSTLTATGSDSLGEDLWPFTILCRRQERWWLTLHTLAHLLGQAQGTARIVFEISKAFSSLSNNYCSVC